ncbi:MAG TPA: hypothetical protein VGE72_21005 [Azospirillum sp.]
MDAAGRHLQDAVAKLEPLLAGPGGAEAHEAIGLIMEAMQRLHDARVHLAARTHSAVVTAAE